MSDSKISALPTKAVPISADILPIVDSTVTDNKKITIGSLPISTATQTALNAKVDKVVGKGLSTEDYTTPEKSKLAGIAAGATANQTDAYLLDRTNHTGTQAPSTIVQDISNRFVTDAEKSTWNSKEPAITVGTTAQYWRGDKSFQTLNKAAVGLPDVANLAPADLPVSTAQATAIGLKENSANKTTNFTGNTGSNTLFPTVKAIFDAIVGYLASYQPLLGYTPANDTLSNLAGTSINDSLLPDTDGVYDIGASGQNWNNVRAKTIGYDGGTAINLDSKKIFDTATEESIDFEARILKDSASLESLNYELREAKDSNGNRSLSWQNRNTHDDSDKLSMEYSERRLFSIDGTTPTLDWSDNAGPTTITQSPNNNSTKIATTAYVDNIAPTWQEFFGGKTLANLTLSGPLTLTNDVFYDTLTLNAGAAITTAGFKIFCKTLDLSNAPEKAISRSGSNGNNASNQTGGGSKAGLLAASTGGGGQGGAGATGFVGAGGIAVPFGSFINANGSNSGAGGAGGLGAGGAGGGSRAASTASTGLGFDRIAFDLLRGANVIGGGAGGPGGSSGGGDGVNLGRGGGGGGSSGGVIAIYARTIITSVSTPSGVIVCNGGNGGHGASATVGNVGGGGGGAGAGGGYTYILYAKRVGPVITNLTTCNGGAGGNAGNGFGTGIGGNGGGGGVGGTIQLFNIVTGIGQKTIGGAGGAGVAGSGVTGGTGGTAGTCLASL